MWSLASWVRGTGGADPLENPLLHSEGGSTAPDGEGMSSSRSTHQHSSSVPVVGWHQKSRDQQRANLPSCHTLPVSIKASTPLTRPDTPKLISLSSADSPARPTSHHAWAFSKHPVQQQQQPGSTQDPFGAYQPLMEPLLPSDSSPAPQQYCNLRTYAQAFPEETHELSHEAPHGWQVTDIQQSAPAECRSRGMKRPENVGGNLYRHDSAASCEGGEVPGRPPLIGRGTVLPALQRGTSDLASPSKMSCSLCRECGHGGPRSSRRASGSPLEIDASRHVSSGEESDDQHENFCQGRQHIWRDKSSGSSGRSPWSQSLSDAVQITGNHGACQGDCSKRPSATDFPLDDLEPGTPPQPTRRSTLHSVLPGSRRSTLSHSSSLGQKLWHERRDADACSTSSQQASLPPNVAAPAVQWLPVVQPSGQVLALPALPAAHAAPATAVADAQAERARDALQLWKGATKWVALWLLLSVLTLLHAGALITAFYEVAIAKVCAVLFCWSGLLGMVGGVQALFAECFARQRSSAQAAANSLGLKTVALVAFMTAVLLSMAATVHMLALQLFTRDAHLPPCAPDQRVCAETYNLLLVLMVATVVMYGVHAAVSAVVACKAHYARQVLRSPGHRSYYP